MRQSHFHPFTVAETTWQSCSSGEVINQSCDSFRDGFRVQCLKVLLSCRSIGLDPASTQQQQIFDHLFRVLVSIVMIMQSNLFSNQILDKIIFVGVL